MGKAAPMALIFPFSTRMIWSLAAVPCAGSRTDPARIATTCANAGEASSSSEAIQLFMRQNL